MATSTTTKAVNYTAEQTAKMVSDYTAGVTTEQIALEMGKSVRSIVAKLSREKVYVAKTYTTKTGETVAKKDAVADVADVESSGPRVLAIAVPPAAMVSQLPPLTTILAESPLPDARFNPIPPVNRTSTDVPATAPPLST